MAEIDASLEELTDFCARSATMLQTARTTEELVAIKEQIHARTSPLATLSKAMRNLPPKDRPRVGSMLHEARAELEAALKAAETRVNELELSARLAAEHDDIANYLYPGRLRGTGALHLITQTRMILEDLFTSMGFMVAEGPEVETEFHNFEALNIPKYHPARANQDSFYLNYGEPESTLLRTHTSPVQIRLMQSRTPPIYAVVPGRVYRRDTPDARHTPAFHQLEALVVDRGISFAHLKATIETFTRAYFGPGIQARLRPAYFPFTEPSAEFEITCTICGGDGCRTCSGTGWIELGGSGMVHPKVFAHVGIDPEEYSGFAFGFGIDRLAQMKVALKDMRILPDNDLRVLAQMRGVL
ncbi:MAG: phenylalanine--tRNA ligase subunit alpha [Ferrimicrobium sp.]|jgi:phenylalanyl-tRNA synthetase alpha chain|uniref:Phenylalanine--tRNA ligase alpha subunit n=1 Tax=Ferrimicrobium acidiphilum TaxID=121039 RepID=A0ABV3XZG1_9ACTN|nr:phenylalanine--tRNA ligase subunit alpha [Ferrimicrobium sp.]MCL5973823.1 phenylalanine--tRNA ligase subunit alpha [Actinomycetota bacterium]